MPIIPLFIIFIGGYMLREELTKPKNNVNNSQIGKKHAKKPTEKTKKVEKVEKVENTENELSE